MSGKKVIIEKSDNAGSRLCCPHCCYCNGKIENSPELEDFIIDPLVRQWMDRNKN